jgi:hypothetical protein
MIVGQVGVGQGRSSNTIHLIVSVIENDRAPVCVLGFGRSGTSLTMRLINLLGVGIGPEEDLQPPLEAENPSGYWEPRWMMELNDEILASLGTVWWRPLQADPGWERHPDLDPLRERARNLLEQKFGSASLWGWKEPRTTLTLPFWQELVPNARYLICLRNPADAVSSFQRRPEPNLPIRAWGDLWLEYTARALQETHGHPRLLVFYEDFFRDGREEIARIASFLGLDVPEENNSIRQLLEEIKPDLRHHSTSSLELAAAWGIGPATRTLFLALRAAEDARRADPSAGGRDELIPKAIERVASELWSEQRMLATYKEAASDRLELVNQLRRTADDRLQLIHKLVHAAEARLHALEAATEQAIALSGQIEERERSCAELSETRDRLDSRERTVEDLEQQVSFRDAELDKLRCWLSEVHASPSWRITAPLRAAKHDLERLQAARPRAAAPPREQSLLAGCSVGQVWGFALVLSSVIAATDAILTNVVLIAMLAIGPISGLLTGRRTMTATVGIWALALAVALGLPDKIWGTSTQFIDLSVVVAAALLSTSAASFIEQRKHHETG